VLKIFNRDEAGYTRFTDASQDFRTTFARLAHPQIRAQSVAVTLMSAPFVGAVVLAVGVWSYRAGTSSAGAVVVVTTIAMLVPVGLSTIGLSTQARNQASDAAARILDVLDRQVTPAPAEPRVPIDGSISLQNVTFAYPNGPTVLRDISLEIPSGATVALVGPSGSGKSTLAAIVARFRLADAGSVHIGGIDAASIDESVLRRHVATMLQNTTLLRMSLFDNIALGHPDATVEEVRAAAEAAGIHDRIAAAPRGYDSVAGDDVMLSGGEVQRLVIARTILTGGPILVLDEATSATDPESERHIQRALDRAAQGRTVVMIAHRLATVAHVDMIVVMNRGCIEELGTHAELIERGGLYSRMWFGANKSEATQ
jgi:ATP-binding cassette subfamily B protein